MEFKVSLTFETKAFVGADRWPFQSIDGVWSGVVLLFLSPIANLGVAITGRARQTPEVSQVVRVYL